MKKTFVLFLQIVLIIFALMAATSILACSPEKDSPSKPEAPGQPGQPDGNNNPGDPGKNNDQMKLRITAGTAIFTATLANNPTAAAFKAMLPMTINMSDMNRNEKYYNLPNSLPTAATSPGTIRNGDIMLYGSGTLVLFYKTFSTSYSYTRIGAIDNPSGLEDALGAGNVTVTLELPQE